MPKDRKKVVAAEIRADSTHLRSDMRHAGRVLDQETRRIQRGSRRLESQMRRSSRMEGPRATDKGRTGRAMRVSARGGMRGLARGAAMLGGAYGIINEARRIKQFEKGLVDIGVQGNLTRDRLAKVRTQILSVSDATGIASDKVRDFVGTIVQETGSVPLATGTLKTMGKVAYATGADMSELASIVVQLNSKAGLTKDQFDEAFGALAEQAQKGSVELKDMADRFPMLLNSMAAFGHKGVDAVKAYGALMQVARRGTVSVEMASIGATRMLDTIISKRSKIEKALDIKLKKDGAWLKLPEMLKLIFTRMEDVRASGGKIGKGKKAMDVEKWSNFIFGSRARRVARVLAGQARTGDWGGKVGEYESFQALSRVGGQGAIQKMMERRRKLSPFEGMTKQLNKLRNEIHRRSLPLLIKLAKAAKDALPYALTMVNKLIDAIKWMAENWKMLLGIWASNKMRVLFSRLAMAGGAGTPMVPGIGGAVGRAGMAAGLAGATGGLGMTAAAAGAAGAGGVQPGGWRSKTTPKSIKGGGWGARPGAVPVAAGAAAGAVKGNLFAKIAKASLVVEGALVAHGVAKWAGEKLGDWAVKDIENIKRKAFAAASQAERQKMIEAGDAPMEAYKARTRERRSVIYQKRVRRWERGGQAQELGRRRDEILARIQRAGGLQNMSKGDRATTIDLIKRLRDEYETAQKDVLKAMGPAAKDLSLLQRTAIYEGSRPLIDALMKLGITINTKMDVYGGKVTGPKGMGGAVTGGGSYNPATGETLTRRGYVGGK